MFGEPPSGTPDGPPCRVRKYLNALAQLSPVSIVLFGSAAKGELSTEASDLDVIVVLRDDASANDRKPLREAIRNLEIAHGFRLPASRPRNALEIFAERAGGRALSCFICRRSDLLSGDVARVFGFRQAEKRFVDPSCSSRL